MTEQVHAIDLKQLHIEIARIQTLVALYLHITNENAAAHVAVTGKGKTVKDVAQELAITIYRAALTEYEEARFDMDDVDDAGVAVQ